MSDWVDTFTVGTGQPKGVPRPVVNRISCAPLTARAVAVWVPFKRRTFRSR